MIFDLTDPILKNVPQQKNGYDCGVFMCTFAKYLSADKAFNFTQNVMKSIRMFMLFEIVHQTLTFWVKKRLLIYRYSMKMLIKYKMTWYRLYFINLYYGIQNITIWNQKNEKLNNFNENGAVK